MKDFEQDYFKFLNKIKNQENFGIVRFGDGEMFIIEGKDIDISQKLWGEHKYTHGVKEDEERRMILTKSLKYINKDYYIGLPCKCCVGEDRFLNIKAQTECDEENLTRANIFVNSNYNHFDKLINELKNRQLILVCNENAKPGQLPFDIEKTYTVGGNSWITGQGIIEEVKEYLKDKENYVVLFCAGVLSNIAVYELMQINKQNTYIDCGSIFDDMMGLGKTRGYLHKNHPNLSKKCIW